MRYRDPKCGTAPALEPQIRYRKCGTAPAEFETMSSNRDAVPPIGLLQSLRIPLPVCLSAKKPEMIYCYNYALAWKFLHSISRGPRIGPKCLSTNRTWSDFPGPQKKSTFSENLRKTICPSQDANLAAKAPHLKANFAEGEILSQQSAAREVRAHLSAGPL